MRIAVLIRGWDREGGAENSALNLASKLSGKHELKIFGYNSENLDSIEKKLLLDKVPRPLQTKYFLNYLESLRYVRDLIDFDPDLILYQHELSLIGSIAARILDSKGVLFIHDYEMLFKDSFTGRNKFTAFVNYVFSGFNRVIVSYIMTFSDLIFVNSDYVKKEYDNEWGYTFHKQYPFVNLENVRTTRTGAKILHVGTSKAKGIEMTIQIAKNSNLEFIVVGTEPENSVLNEMRELDNLCYRGRVEHIKDAYSEAEIIIMPVKWEEPFGMVPIEAGISGIPSVVSDSGGLPESVGLTSLVVKENSPEAFIDRILHVREHYDRFSSEVRLNSLEKSLHNQFGFFRNKLRKFLDINL